MDLDSLVAGAALATVLLGSYYEWRTHRLIATLDKVEHAVATEFVRLIAEDKLEEQLDLLDSQLIPQYRVRRHLRQVTGEQP